jgi:hypothetical protein
MIKKILGFLFSVAAIATIIIVAMNFGSYNSIFLGEESPAATPQNIASEPVADFSATEPAVEQDSLMTSDVATPAEGEVEMTAQDNENTTATSNEEADTDGE